jgi:hypothetical protein
MWLAGWWVRTITTTSFRADPPLARRCGDSADTGTGAVLI